MIFLIGGTSEAVPIAGELAVRGMPVLLSTATEIPLHAPLPRGVQRRTGRLDREGMLRVIRAYDCRVVVDASHPYAAEVSRCARAAAQAAKIPYVAYDRPPAVPPGAPVTRAADHVQASRAACACGVPVLLTIGTKYLEPYVTEAGRRNIRLVVRILDVAQSWTACRRLGLSATDIVAGRGRLDYEETLALLKDRGIGVLVTKDSGREGGVPAKLKAAEAAGCRVVVVERPARPRPAFRDIGALVDAVGYAWAEGVLPAEGRGPAKTT